MTDNNNDQPCSDCKGAGIFVHFNEAGGRTEDLCATCNGKGVEPTTPAASADPAMWAYRVGVPGKVPTAAAKEILQATLDNMRATTASSDLAELNSVVCGDPVESGQVHPESAMPSSPAKGQPRVSEQASERALRLVAEEAAAVFESAAKHNAKQGRTVFAHEQQERANRLRAAITQQAAPEAPTLILTDEEIGKVRAAKRVMVDALISSNLRYGTCGAISHRLEKLIDGLASSVAAPEAPASVVGLIEENRQLTARMNEYRDQLTTSEESRHELLRLLNEETGGRTFMGEPVIAPPAATTGSASGRKEMDIWNAGAKALADRAPAPHNSASASGELLLTDDDLTMLTHHIGQMEALATGTINGLGSDNLLKPGKPKQATIADAKRILSFVIPSLRKLRAKLESAPAPSREAAPQAAATFEAWAEANGYVMAINPETNDYQVGTTRTARDAWSAAVAQQSAERAVAVVDEGDEGLFIDFIYSPNGSPLKRGDKLYASRATGSGAGAAAEAANEMRIALTVQISELIDVAERCARRAHKQGDTEERDYVQGAIDYARKVAEPYSYNGPLRAAHPGDAPAGGKCGAA